MIKTSFDKKPQINLVARPDIFVKNIKAMLLIKKELKKIKLKFSR